MRRQAALPFLAQAKRTFDRSPTTSSASSFFFDVSFDLKTPLKPSYMIFHEPLLFSLSFRALIGGAPLPRETSIDPNLTTPSLPFSVRRTILRDDDTAIAVCNEMPEFLACFNYLQTKLHPSQPDPSEDLRRRLAKVCCQGFTSDGTPFSMLSPVIPSLEATKNVIEFLEGFPGIDLHRAFLNSPHAIMHPLAISRHALEDRARAFSSRLGLSRDDLGRLFNNNVYFLLQGSVRTRGSRRPEEGYGMSVGGLSISSMEALIDRSSGVETVVVTEDLPVFRCLEVIERLGFTREETRSIILRSPKLLSARPERLHVGIQTLHDTIGMDEEQVKKAIWRQPCIIYISVDKINALLEWMKSNGLKDREKISATLASFPHLMSFNQMSNLNSTTEFLRKEAGLSEGHITRILRYAPDVYARSISRLRQNMASYRQAGMNDLCLAAMLAKYPGHLRFDISRSPYSEKVRYLKEVLGREIGPTLATNPMYLSYNMDRIASRHEFLMKKRRRDFALTSWLSASSVRFATQFAESTLEEWTAFLAEWRRRKNGEASASPRNE